MAHPRDETEPLPDCTCHLETVNSASRDLPDWVRDPWCPHHGWRDADREYEERRDRAAEPPEPMETDRPEDYE